jgi:hypothetical protein
MLSPMPADRDPNLPAPRDPRTTALARRPRDDDGPFPIGLFCASPTVLEAINAALHHRGLPTLWVQPDGSIGPTDPLILRVECDPFPFVAAW